MTRLRIISDLHLEFGPLTLDPAGEDVLVLAGDIGPYTMGAEWAVAESERLGVPVVMIAGNHEFYRRRRKDRYTMHSVIAALRETAASSGGRLTFLDDEVSVIAGVRFIGATLWTDFSLLDSYVMGEFRARSLMNDYRKIYRDRYHRIFPSTVHGRHRVSREFISRAIDEPFAGPTVVTTHHLPSAQSLDGRYNGQLAMAYASDLDELVCRSAAAIWVHGHTHISQDYRIGDTRIICNPRGYVGVEANPKFDAGLIIEV